MAKFNTTDWGDQFQTPPEICAFMCKMIDLSNAEVLEPYPGKGNLVRSIEAAGGRPVRNLSESTKICVMNPPFSPMKDGYKTLDRMTDSVDFIVALMPWLTLINGEKRLAKILDYGLVSITHLPRKTFPGARVQTCILNMRRGFTGITKFSAYVPDDSWMD